MISQNKSVECVRSKHCLVIIQCYFNPTSITNQLACRAHNNVHVHQNMKKFFYVPIDDTIYPDYQ